MTFASVMIIGLVCDALIGWPDRVYQKIGHPVTWIGRLITRLEAHLNQKRFSDRQKRVFGALTVLCVICVVAVISAGLAASVPEGWLGVLITGILVWPLIAMRSLNEHVAAVAKPLSKGDLSKARRAVSMIVGRDPEQLDAAGISRASLETLAENTSDGVVAPVFWGVLFGLPGIAVYKAINTLDSMIGHRNARYEHFGKVAARLDDVVNLVPARLTGVLFAIATPRVGASLNTMWRDAGQHRSPNAGWPEAAMAGALTVRLSGPRVYGDSGVDEPWVNDDAQDPTAQDIWRGLALYRRAMLAGLGVLGLLAACG